MAKKKLPEEGKPKSNNPNVMGLHAEVQEQPITDTLEVNYMPYAMSVIVSRAIPEIDGFKPSHRKLLYTMGAFAVEYITCTSQSQRSYYEVSVQISYRRTAEQIQAVVNATSTSALPSLLDAALSAEKKELAVRIGYWDSDSAGIDAIVEQVRTDRGLTADDPAWTVSYYPKTGTVGLIEFVFSS